MKYNYHTHTIRCHHASGTDQELVEAAIQRGLSFCGFSDHAPFAFPNGYESSFRVPVAQAQEYVDSINTLKTEYQNDIELHVGFEMEYYPDYFNDMVTYAKSLGAEYVILGQHSVHSEPPRVSPQKTNDPEIFATYVRNVIKAMESGAYTYFAHPDLVLKSEPSDDDLENIRPIVTRAKELGIPLEINLHGMHEKTSYPVERFWELVGSEHADVILGIDAHSVEQLTETETETRAMEWVHRYGLHLLEKTDLVLLNKN